MPDILVFKVTILAALTSFAASFRMISTLRTQRRQQKHEQIQFQQRQNTG